MISVVNMKNIRGKFHGRPQSFVTIVKKNEKRYFFNYNITVFE